jgi:hypothetical protein
MKADRARASAASVFDALGSDFWAWWRTTMGAGLLALLLAIVAVGFGSPTEGSFGSDLVLMLGALGLSACMGVVGFLAAQRHHRWAHLRGERRLPGIGAAPHLDAIGYLALATLLWVGLAIWAIAAAVHPIGHTLSTAAPWIAVALVGTAVASASVKLVSNGERQALAALAYLVLYLSMGPVLNAILDMHWGVLVAVAVLGGGLLHWSYMPSAAHGSARKPWLPTWPSGVLKVPASWMDHWGKSFLATSPLLLLTSTQFASAFIEGQSRPAQQFLLLGYCFLVVTMLAFTWQAPEQHVRLRLSPSFARQRPVLALRLWRSLCLRTLPLLVLPPLVTSVWMSPWAHDMPALEAMLKTALALPWLIANGALLMAAVTLWVGVRRHRLGWDLVPLAAYIVCTVAGLSLIGARDAHLAQWGARWDMLATLVMLTMALLALACWAWSRGSLTGMERWSVAKWPDKR